jgi:hypothetical protein
MARVLRTTLPWAALAALLLLGVPENGIWNAVGGVDRSLGVPQEPVTDDLMDRLARLEAENLALRESVGRLDGLETELNALREAAAVKSEREPAFSLHPFVVPESATFCGETIPLHRPDVHRRFEDEWYRFVVNRHWLISWMRRTRDAFPAVEAKLAAAGLPDDLKYVMVIESASNPRATSSAGAVGYWQFIRSTGKRYGLDRDSTVDERRSLDLSTDAAIAYLTELYAEFQSWPLALSGYNAGEKRVRKEIEAQGTNDFYAMVLPRETEAYWFKAAATKILFENRERYGFALPEDNWTKVACDTLMLKVRRKELPFREIAAVTGLTYREIKALNPQYRTSSLPKGEHRLVLPTSVAANVERSLSKIEVVERASSTGATGSAAQTSGPGP